MNIKKYLIEVRAEMNKVSWPSKQKAVKDSVVVIAASIVTSLFIGGVDSLFSYVAQKVIMK